MPKICVWFLLAPELHPSLLYRLEAIGCALLRCCTADLPPMERAAVVAPFLLAFASEEEARGGCAQIPITFEV